MTTRHGEGWLGLMLAGALAAGCGGSTPESAQAPRQAAPTAVATGQNACALVDLAEIEAIAGVKLAMLHDVEDDDQTTCELRDPEGTVLTYVTVHWRGGKALADAEQTSVAMAGKLLGDKDTDILALTGSESVKGLADRAFYSDVMPSWVVKGDVMVQVISPRFPGEQTRKVFLAVARTALKRS